MSSTRLPGKTLMDLGGKPVIDHVIARGRRATLADDFAVATTTHESDDALARHLEAAGVPFVRGSLDDVLSRYALAAESFSADTVVRITCDCPLIDPAVIDDVISAYRQAPHVDYCSNVLLRTYPIGMDTEVFSRAALERAHAEAEMPQEREHVTPYIYQHPQDFALRNVQAPEWAHWPDVRLTLDEQRDLDMLQAVIDRVGESASLRKVIGVLRTDPAMAELNREVAHRQVEKPQTW